MSNPQLKTKYTTNIKMKKDTRKIVWLRLFRNLTAVKNGKVKQAADGVFLKKNN